MRTAGKLPFGTATRVAGQNYSYHISPKLFTEYMRCTLEDIENFFKEFFGSGTIIELAVAALAVGFAVGVLIHTWILTTIP